METVQYALRGVSIEQYATLFEPSGDNVRLNLNIPIKTNYYERTVAVGANIQFLENDRTFLTAEVLCHFIIDESYWNVITDNCKKDAVLPKELIYHLGRIAISTSRGALCAKTENTPFAKFFLPVIEMQEDNGEDVVIPVSPDSNA